MSKKKNIVGNFGAYLEAFRKSIEYPYPACVFGAIKKCGKKGPVVALKDKVIYDLSEKIGHESAKLLVIMALREKRISESVDDLGRKVIIIWE